MDSSKGKLTSSAQLEYTLVLISVAVPMIKSPAPCQTCEHAYVSEGRWMKVQGEHTSPARLEYTLVLIRVTVPSM